MNALIAEVSFFEALFKSHYTKGFRLSYLIPLPTSVAGIFGAMLGISRQNLASEFTDIYFGAILKNYGGIISENVTFFQDKPGNPTKGVAKTLILNEPNYLIAMAGREEELRRYMRNLKERIQYMPYGGQNDFFLRDLNIQEEFENVGDNNLIANYAPSDWVEDIKSSMGAEIQILPVMHRLETSRNFHFIHNGLLRISRSIPSTKRDHIGLYKLDNFYLVG